MTDPTSWLVIVVDDDEEICESIEEFISQERLTDKGDVARVFTETDFSNALTSLSSGRYDLAVLDVRKGEYDQFAETEAGAKLLEDIKKTRFLPIIFYTGLPKLVTHLVNPPFIQVVEKSGTHEALAEAIRETLDSKLPRMNRALTEHIDSVQRDYMWDFVAEQWDAISKESDKTSVGHLLARRLARSLSDPTMTGLVSNLGGPGEESIGTDQIHSMQYYIMPAIEEPAMMVGDIYMGEIEGQSGFWVMMTPTCDLIQNKAELLLLAVCNRLSEQPEYAKWVDSRSNTATANLRKLLENNRESAQRDRYFYLPAAMNIPDLVADLQDAVVLRRDTFEAHKLERLATLDSPFIEALTSQFCRLYGRIGTPDLNMKSVIQRLESGLT